MPRMLTAPVHSRRFNLLAAASTAVRRCGTAPPPAGGTPTSSTNANGTDSDSTTTAANVDEQLASRIPFGWRIIAIQEPIPVVGMTREPDADGVVIRPEAEHRKIFSPYATSSPFSAVPIADGERVPYISKAFSFGQYGPLYHWMGRVGAMAEHLHVYPNFDWFFLEVTATLPLTESGLHMAWYMNDEEATRGEFRNTSDGGTQFTPDKSMALAHNNPCAIDTETRRRIEGQALGQFCWVIAGDVQLREIFTSEVYLQWYHRADYLVSRKAKEFSEYRKNLTLEQLLQSASQNRKRRKERAEDIKAQRDKFKPMPTSDLPPQFLKFKSKQDRDAARSMQLFGMDGRDGTSEVRSTEELSTDDVNEMSPSRAQFAIDTIPREIRERMEAEDGMTGFGGGTRQADPVNFARTVAPQGFGSSSVSSGGAWHP